MVTVSLIQVIQEMAKEKEARIRELRLELAALEHDEAGESSTRTVTATNGLRYCMQNSRAQNGNNTETCILF